MRSNYIGGTWTSSASDAGIDVLNPATEEVIDRVPAGHPADVDAAVGAARAAFSGWAATPVAERARHLEAARELLAERAEAVAAVIAADMGAPLVFARKVQVGTPLLVLASYVELLSSYDFSGERVGNSLIVREAGHRRGDHPVELPAVPDSEQGGRRARGRMPDRAQAERGGPARRL